MPARAKLVEPMRLLLQRYLAANFILPLVISLVFFISFLLTFELFRLMSLLASRDISALFLAQLMGNLALTFIPLALPLAVFFSMLFCMNKLSTDSEYIAMRAAGFSRGRLFLPFLLVAGVVATSTYHLGQSVLPYTNRDFKRQLNFLTSSGLIASLRSGQFFTSIPKITLFPVKISPDGRQLERVFLHMSEKSGERMILARSGELLYERDLKTLIEKLTLNLFDGSITTLKGDGSEVEKILFQSYSLPISQNRFSDRISPKETMLSEAELQEVLAMAPADARKKYGFKPKDIFNARYELWNRRNTPVLCLLLCFLGFSLGVKESRGKGRNGALLGLLSLIAYYALFFGLVGAARKEVIAVPLAMLLPDLLLLAIGAHFYRKLNWQ